MLLAATAVTAIATAGTVMAQAEPTTAATDDGQVPAVEDFAYPDADRIFTETGVRLISGDGHILLADCSTQPVNGIGVMRVRSSESVGVNRDGRVCFRITGTPGVLQLRLPVVYEIRGDGYAPDAGHVVKALLTTDSGTQTTVDVNPRASTPVGVGISPGNPPTTLLQLTASS
ncbi:hypothetical protein [Saccharothrix coeruleofusca]|uniref:Secreted protein n=1 Tax=Saccharothrix coeruleofusca TaxID=33919 RepID=A0A918AL52_9PSEU|nr:hypothetical protein [Saccharothrix coeruleofusca]GGP41346.1 hypothetical protein GCM10010185_10620 [Saccharothrix coeruleofusca]